MLKTDVTETVKRRLKYNNICPICGSEIKDYQDFQFVSFRRGSYMCYKFFHTFCLVQKDDREEEVIYG